MIKIDLITCHQDLVRGGCYYILLIKTTLQYESHSTIHGPYKYDRIVHNIEKNYAKRQNIGQTNGKINLILKIKICVIR